MSTEPMGSQTGTADTGTPTTTPSATGGMADASTQPDAAASTLTSDTSNQTIDAAQASTSAPQTSMETSPKKDEPPANPWESDDNVYKKRFNDVLSNAQKHYQENQLLQQKHQALEAQYRAMKEAETQRAQQMKLKDWHPRSPNYQTTKAVYDRMNNFIKARNALPQEVLNNEGVIKNLASQFGVTADDAKVYQQIEIDREQTKEKLLSDPEAFFDEMFESRIVAKLQEYEQFNQARASAQTFLQDPKVQPLIQEYAVEMDRMMNPEVPGRDKAMMVAQLLHENKIMKEKLGASAMSAAHADAQQALKQGVPARSRRGVGSQTEDIGDPVKHFASKGLKGTDLAMAIARYNASKNS